VLLLMLLLLADTQRQCRRAVWPTVLLFLSPVVSHAMLALPAWLSSATLTTLLLSVSLD
jgi:hypothetical protein